MGRGALAICGAAALLLATTSPAFAVSKNVDHVLKLTFGAQLARSATREVTATPPSAKQRRFLARLARTYRADPATRGLCRLIQ